MKTEVNWLMLLVLLTTILLATLSIIGADLYYSDNFANDNSGRLTLTVAERPQTAEETAAVKYENG